MEYTKEMLIEEAIKRFDTIDEILEHCQRLINGIYAEKETARYLLWLGFEKKEKEINIE
jgi:hypothetical protein